MHQLTYSIEPRMDGNVAQRLAWRVVTLREALESIRTTTDSEAGAQFAANAIGVDDYNATKQPPQTEPSLLDSIEHFVKLEVRAMEERLRIELINAGVKITLLGDEDE